MDAQTLEPVPRNAAPSPATQVQVPSRPLPALVPARDVYNQQSLGAVTNASVKQSRILMVGAGGVGCELLKNLVLAGFGSIEIVDLDTIDVSNLNRQFLFRAEHVKKSKALVAKEAAQRFNPAVEITAHHANIRDPRFSVAWYRRFGIVFNALDNLEARRHVNMMCLAADRPLIESGTTGFNGQCQVIKRGRTACYDCIAKTTQKSYPVCTIRSTPTQPVHCVVWAKSYLLSEVFGTSEDEPALDYRKDKENEDEIEMLRKESRALRGIRDSLGTEGFARMLFDKVFKADIERLLAMEDMWKFRRPPQPLSYESLADRDEVKQALATTEATLRDGQNIWSLAQNLAVFVDSLDRLSKRMLALEKDADPAAANEPVIVFDKDDPDTLDFVTASANIRSTAFGIPTKSRFDIKEIAGNIIPAIATTNAMVAGLCVLQAFKVLKGDYSLCKEPYLSPWGGQYRAILGDKCRAPNPTCGVCGVYRASVSVDMDRATLNDIVETVQTDLGYREKEFSLVDSAAQILYDPDETENLGKKLSELGVNESTFITVKDEEDTDTLVDVVLSLEVKEKLSLDSNDKAASLILQTSLDIPRKPPAAKGMPIPNGNETARANGSADGKSQGKVAANGVIYLDVDVPGAASERRKRPRADDSDQPGVKRTKTESLPADSDEAVAATNDSSGVIVLD